jgi:hypothetical protein
MGAFDESSMRQRATISKIDVPTRIVHNTKTLAALLLIFWLQNSS